MSDTGDPDDDITATHPTARHLRPAAPPPGATASGPLSATFPAEAYLSTEAVAWGPDIPDERSLRLLGQVDDRRILELGCGGGQAAVALARQGARVIGVDPDRERLDAVRALAEEAEVRVELHQSDLAELAFLRADTIDAAFSVFALGGVGDLDRVFRQVHRVLRTGSVFVLSLPHPAYALVDAEGADPTRIVRSYFDREPVPWVTGSRSGTEYPRSVSELVTSLLRANFRIDGLLEPPPATDGVHSRFWTGAMPWVPATLLIRARKEGT